MKATKYLAMAAAALAFAACSSDELASVADRNANGLRPVEFSTVVKNQTRAGQIYNDAEFATIYMKTTGTFYAEDGTKVVDPSLLLTKSGSTWTYKVNGAAEASTLYWPLESYDNTFQAWYYDGGAAQARGLTMVFDETTSVSEELRVKSEEFAPATEWYTLDGRKLDGKPTTKGLYIHNGRKIIIK